MINLITQKMSLEAMKNGVQETVYAKKGERAARTLSITLTSGGKVLNIAGYLVRVVFPDQTVLNLSNTNPVQFTIPQTLCASPGEYVCELQLRNAYNTEIFYSPMFRIIVEDSLTVTEPAQQIGEDVSYVEAETGKSLMTDAERAKLAGIEDGAEVNPTNVSAFTNDAGYQNAAQVDARIAQVQGMLPIPVIPGDEGKAPIVNESGAYELEEITLEQAQADWSQADNTAPDYIKNKPTNVSAFVNDAGYLTTHQDISGKEDKSNKVTTISASSTDTQYPSAKCMYDLIGDCQTAIDTLNSYISLELTAVIGGSY